MTARVLAIGGLAPWARRVRVVLVALVALVGLVAGHDSYAQGYSTACRTARGICPVSPAPVNAACRCYSDPGRIVAPPSNWSRTCQVQGGQCPAPHAYPAGAPCRCGNLDGRLR